MLAQLVKTEKRAAAGLRNLKQAPTICPPCAPQNRTPDSSNRAEFVATYVTYKWRDRRGNVSTLKTLIAMKLAGVGPATSIANAKQLALNLGIHIAGRQDRLLTASKRYPAFTGKREAEKAFKRLQQKHSKHDSYDEACPLCLEEIAMVGASA